MQTHYDEQHRSEFMEALKRRADKALESKASEITAGAPGEEALAKWKHKGMHVKHMPEDQQGILRISIGGGDHLPVTLNYCVIRGSVGECIDLLERAIEALRAAP